MKHRSLKSVRKRFQRPLLAMLLGFLFLFGSIGPYFAQTAQAATRREPGFGGNNHITDDCRSYTDTAQYIQCLSIFGSDADKLIAEFNEQLKRANTVEEVRALMNVDPNSHDSTLLYRNVINNKEWIIPTKTFETDDREGLPNYLKENDGRPEKVFEKAKNFRTDVFVDGAVNDTDGVDEYIYPDKGTYVKLYLAGGWYLGDDQGKFLKDLAGDPGDSLSDAAKGCTVAGGPASIGCAPGAVGGFLASNAGAVSDAIGMGATRDVAVWYFTSPNNKSVYGTVQCAQNEGKTDPGDDSGIGPLARGSAFFFSDDGKPQLGANTSSEASDPQSNIIPDDELIGKRTQTVNPTTGQIDDGREYYDTALARWLCSHSNDPEQFADFCKSKFSDENCVYDERSLLEAIIGNPIQKALSWARDAANSLMQLSADAVKTIITATNLGSFPGLLSGWKVMRDLANIVFVLLLSAVAFSSILRIDTERYGVRRLLPRLIFAVIAVNFSLLFVIMITNVAQILSQPFIGGVQTLLNSNPADNVQQFVDLGDVGGAIIGIILVIIIAIVLALLALLFIVRMMILLILGALGPMAVLFAVMPISSGLAKSWFDNVVKWAMMAPVALVIVYLGANFTRTAGNFGNDLVQTGVFLIAVLGALIIPIELGGKAMNAVRNGVSKTGSKAYGAGRLVGGGAAGYAARRTGLAAAWEQQKAKTERDRELKGAGIRQRVAGRANKMSGGLIGGQSEAEAEMQLAGHVQDEAQMYAGKFDAEQLGNMQNRFKPGSEMHEMLGMARDIRTGTYQARQQADQESGAIAAFEALPEPQQAQRIARITDRNVKQESPQFLEHLATTGQISQMATGGIEGILEQNQEGQINALRTAHQNGHITDRQLAGLSPEDRRLYDHRIIQGSNEALPSRDQKSSRPDIREQLPNDYKVDDDRDQAGL